jgi:hypothetical protein
MNAIARIQNTNLAELRMVWSTSRTPWSSWKREGEKQKKLSGEKG